MECVNFIKYEIFNKYSPNRNFYGENFSNELAASSAANRISFATGLSIDHRDGQMNSAGSSESYYSTDDGDWNKIKPKNEYDREFTTLQTVDHSLLTITGAMFSNCVQEQDANCIEFKGTITAQPYNLPNTSQPLSPLYHQIDTKYAVQNPPYSQDTFEGNNAILYQRIAKNEPGESCEKVDSENNSMPYVTDPQNQIALPYVTDPQNQIALPYVTDPQNQIALPYVTDPQNQIALPYVTDPQNQIAMPYVTDPQNQIALPYVTDQQNQLALPYVTDPQNQLALPYVTDPQNQIALPYATDPQNQINQPAPNMGKYCKPECDPEKAAVFLCNSDLWARFHAQTTEMILTKRGRRMFPILKLSFIGLDPNKLYNVFVDLDQVDNHYWKYQKGKWIPVGPAEQSPQTGRTYLHPDSPNTGTHWMKRDVNFSKLKITNDKKNPGGNIVVSSLRKYQPRINVAEVGNGENDTTLLSHVFPETQFVTVTAYQNTEQTQLKIDYNPFAKAFRTRNGNGEAQPNSRTGTNRMMTVQQDMMFRSCETVPPDQNYQNGEAEPNSRTGTNRMMTVQQDMMFRSCETVPPDQNYQNGEAEPNSRTGTNRMMTVQQDMMFRSCRTVPPDQNYQNGKAEPNSRTGTNRMMTVQQDMMFRSCETVPPDENYQNSAQFATHGSMASQYFNSNNILSPNSSSYMHQGNFVNQFNADSAMPINEVTTTTTCMPIDGGFSAYTNLPMDDGSNAIAYLQAASSSNIFQHALQQSLSTQPPYDQFRDCYPPTYEQSISAKSSEHCNGRANNGENHSVGCTSAKQMRIAKTE